VRHFTTLPNTIPALRASIAGMSLATHEDMTRDSDAALEDMKHHRKHGSVMVAAT
jgi:hypothetical protein